MPFRQRMARHFGDSVSQCPERPCIFCRDPYPARLPRSTYKGARGHGCFRPFNPTPYLLPDVAKYLHGSK